MFPVLGRKENSTLTPGNRGTFVGTDEFISKYIRWYLKSTNIGLFVCLVLVLMNLQYIYWFQF
jgi:hypothetical protein